jgi:predicted GNAT superfamily acetyltransferase
LCAPIVTVWPLRAQETAHSDERMPIAEPSIVIRELSSLADYDACVALQDDTWGHGFSERVPGAILQVAQKLGGVAAGAFDESGRLLGFVFGMTGLKNGAVIHWSDMLAVRPEARGSRLGERLKVYQRDAVRRLGVSTMQWTADPLVARNAHLNINVLGARPTEYVENMYGEHTGSALHGAMPTDRFVYTWHLTPGEAGTADAGGPAPGDALLPVAVTIGDDALPCLTDTGSAAAVRVPIPDDLTTVQSQDAARALAWRLTVRRAIVPLMQRGYTATRFVRAHADALPYYIYSARR